MRLQKKIHGLIFIFFLLGSALIFKSIHWKDSKNVRSILKTIPKEDRYILDAFFKILLFRTPFSYVLFGDKPISAADYVDIRFGKLKDYGSISYYPLQIRNIVLRDGWVVWEKYRHLFPSKHFILQHFYDENKAYRFIFFINTKTVKEIFAKNRCEFVKKYGPDITSERFLEICVGAQSPFISGSQENHAILGILFGFGSHNAKLFQQRRDLQQRIKHAPFSTHAISEEIQRLNAKLQFFGDASYPRLRLLRLPTFAADQDHEETRVLKAKYEKQRREITNYYQNGDFLELTLKKFME